MQNTLNKRFGERARAYRMSLGVSLLDLEREHGLNNRTISAMELGTRRWNLDQIEVYCAALGVEPWRLLKWDEPLPEAPPKNE